MATYAQIQEDVKRRDNVTVKTCWIAHVKELNGLPLRAAPNRISKTVRHVPCPPEVRPIIERSMRRFRML
jgi:hypothetical protein